MTGKAACAGDPMLEVSPAGASHVHKLPEIIKTTVD